MNAPVGDERRRLRDRLRRPRTHWFVLVIWLVVLLVMFATAAALDASGSSREVGPGALAHPSSTGPVIDLSGPTLRSGHGDRDIGVAIIGLPDRATTDRLVRILHEKGAAATWFVRGEDLVWRPQAIDRIRTAGLELGVTGYGGHDLRWLPPWRVRLELSVSQAAMAARQGRTSRLLLLPATPTRDALDARALRTARAATDEGYLLVAGTSPERVRAGDVAVIDTRDRQRAIDDLEALVDGRRPIRAVGATVGLGVVDVNPPVGGLAEFDGWLVMGAVTLSEVVSHALPWFFFPITALLAVRVLLTVVFGLIHARRHHDGPRWTGPVSVIVPAYNEAAGIEATVRSLAASSWEHGVEIIVVDDGSDDGTADIAESLGLPQVRVIRQANTGKPGALNTGVAAASAEVVVLVDGDTIFQPDTVRELVSRFGDPHVGAVSGNAKVANRSSLLGRWQHIEYVMGFNLDRRLLDQVHAIGTVPGAVGAFRTDALAAVGGVSDDTIAEDTDLTIALNRAGWRVVYEPDAIAWTEAPSSLGDLWKQRYRWSYGILQSVWKHRAALREGTAIGWFGIPYTLVFQVLIGLVAPIVDVAALFALATGGTTIVRIWVVFAVLQVLLAAFAFWLDGESWRPLWAVPLQQFFYRQLMYLVVIQAAASAATGARLRWHKLHRTGIAQPPLPGTTR